MEYEPSQHFSMRRKTMKNEFLQRSIVRIGTGVEIFIDPWLNQDFKQLCSFIYQDILLVLFYEMSFRLPICNTQLRQQFRVAEWCGSARRSWRPRCSSSSTSTSSDMSASRAIPPSVFPKKSYKKFLNVHFQVCHFTLWRTTIQLETSSFSAKLLPICSLTSNQVFYGIIWIHFLFFSHNTMSYQRKWLSHWNNSFE